MTRTAGRLARTRPLDLPGPLGRRGRRTRSALRRAVWRLGRWAAGVAQRGGDLAIAALLVSVGAPLFAGLAARALHRRGRLFDRTTLIGRHRRPFDRLAFAGGGRGAALAVLFNVVRGDLALVGPRALPAAEAAALPVAAQVRFDVRPGLFSPYGLRRRAGVAYDAEHAVDREFVLAQSTAGDLGVLARALPAALLGAGAARPAPERLCVFGVTMANTTMDEALDWISARAADGRPSLAAFVNPDCLNIAYRSADYRAALAGADQVWPDGIGLRLAGRLLGWSLRANVNGTDLFPRLCARCAATGQSLFLFGARPGVAAAAAEAMRVAHPGLRIAGVRDGYHAAGEEEGVVAAINASGADILLVALGAPRQELWLAAQHQRLRPAVRIGVGGLFDYYSGRIPRAPQWMREIGLEWVWRMAQEPGRLWRRYLIGNPLFLWRVWRQRRSAAGGPVSPPVAGRGTGSVTPGDSSGRRANPSALDVNPDSDPQAVACRGMSPAKRVD